MTPEKLKSKDISISKIKKTTGVSSLNIERL